LVERERVYRCAECKYEFMVRVDVMHDNTVSLPTRCPNPTPLPVRSAGGKRGGRGAGVGRYVQDLPAGEGVIDGGGGRGEEDMTTRMHQPPQNQQGNKTLNVAQDTGQRELEEGEEEGGFAGTYTATAGFERTEQQPQKSRRCACTKFEGEEAGAKSNYQEGKLLERPASLPPGAIPRSLTLVLEEDLVDSLSAGGALRVLGTLVHRWLPLGKGQRAILDVVLCVNSATPLDLASLTRDDEGGGGQRERNFDDFWEYFKGEARPLAGRNAIVRSICPQLHSMYMPKLALACVVIGGVELKHNTGSKGGPEEDEGEASAGIKRRGDCHILLVGDPGTGKSQLMAFAALLLPGSVSTNAVSTTAAGLTCAVSSRDGEAVLEPGALVLADRTLCCIDEFNHLGKGDKEAMHEAMEQQTVSAAKAGIVGRLYARCTIVAACNQKGQPGSGVDLTALVGLGDPLLSRFDLVLALPDKRSQAWDVRLSSLLLQNASTHGFEVLQKLGATQEADVQTPKHTVSSLLGLPAHQFPKYFLQEQESAYSSLVRGGSSTSDSVRTQQLGADLPPSLWRNTENRRNEDPLTWVVVCKGSASAAAAAKSSAVTLPTTKPPLPSFPAFDASLVPPGVDRMRAMREWEAAAAAHAAAAEVSATSGMVSERGDKFSSLPSVVLWSLPLLSAYLQQARRSSPIPITDGAGQLLILYYSLLRSFSQEGVSSLSPSRLTVRMLESLMRLTQSHARLCAREKALIQDAVSAILLMEYSTTSIYNLCMGESFAGGGPLGLPSSFTNQSEFPGDPDGEYRMLEGLVINRLAAWQARNRGGMPTISSIPSTPQAWFDASNCELAEEAERERRKKRGMGRGEGGVGSSEVCVDDRVFGDVSPPIQNGEGEYHPTHDDNYLNVDEAEPSPTPCPPPQKITAHPSPHQPSISSPRPPSPALPPLPKTTTVHCSTSLIPLLPPPPKVPQTQRDAQDAFVIGALETNSFHQANLAPSSTILLAPPVTTTNQSAWATFEGAEEELNEF